MAYSSEALSLLKPAINELPRLNDRVSFLFLDRARIEQGRTGLEAWVAEGRVAIPSASLAVLLLGPGTSISSPAMTSLFRQGTAVIFTDSSGMVGYAAAKSLSSTAKFSYAQARIWADKNNRLKAAKFLYLARFPDEVLPENINLNTLRGIEGQKVKSLYKIMAARYKIKNFRRQAQDAPDKINLYLSRGNSILYGVALSACSALGVNPALGFIHEGASGALLYDLADIYKPEITIPLAFQTGSGALPEKSFGSRIREILHQENVQSRMLTILQETLDPALKESDGTDLLLADKGSFIGGHTNWGQK